MLTSCEKEPIHQLGFLQGRGFLIGIEPVHFSITQVSENINEYLPFEAKKLLGQNIKSIDPYFILEKLTLSSFVKKLSPTALSYFSPVLKLKKDDRKFYLAPSFSGKTLLLELEPVILKSSISDKVSKIIGLILEQKNPDDCMDITIQNIKELIGFSR
mgnify:FL=1